VDRSSHWPAARPDVLVLLLREQSKRHSCGRHAARRRLLNRRYGHAYGSDAEAVRTIAIDGCSRSGRRFSQHRPRPGRKLATQNASSRKWSRGAPGA
jgi:hypothetical protein